MTIYGYYKGRKITNINEWQELITPSYDTQMSAASGVMLVGYSQSYIGTSTVSLNCEPVIKPTRCKYCRRRVGFEDDLCPSCGAPL